jgi:hypothetical protein
MIIALISILQGQTMKRSIPEIMLTTFGVAFTAMNLAWGCFGGGVKTFTCIRDQGICRSEESSTFLPWRKTIHTIAIKDIQRAELREFGEGYTVVLLSAKNKPILSISAGVDQMNSFLHNPEAKNFTSKAGGDPGETIILIGNCIMGLFVSFLPNLLEQVRHHANISQE